jgi:RecB family exonuclease
MQISNSKLNTYRRCPNKFRYRYVLKLRPKKRVVQLERGSWIHELLMVHNDGEDWRIRHRQLTKKFQNLWEEEREDLGDLPGECARIMFAYLRTYKSDAQRYRVIDSELDEVVSLPNGLKLNVIVDVVLEDIIDGGIWLRDYKTRDKFTRSENMMLDPQMTLYFWSMEQMGYKPIRGAQYDEIRTKAPSAPHLNKDGGLSKAKSIDTDVWTYMHEIKRYDLDPADYEDILRHIAVNQKDRFFRRTPIPKDRPVIQTTMREAVQTAQEIQQAEQRHRFPRTFDTSCTWQCEYRDLCIAELYGGNIDPLIKMNFEQGKDGDGSRRRLKKF